MHIVYEFCFQPIECDSCSNIPDVSSYAIIRSRKIYNIGFFTLVSFVWRKSASSLGRMTTLKKFSFKLAGDSHHAIITSTNIAMCNIYLSMDIVLFSLGNYLYFYINCLHVHFDKTYSITFEQIVFQVISLDPCRRWVINWGLIQIGNAQSS